MKCKVANLALSIAFVSSLTFSAGLFAQEPAQQTMQARNENPAPAKSAAATAAQPDVLFGRIQRSSGSYILVESATKAHYALDDQKKARQYDGRVVAITGTVSNGSHTVHVQKIEVAA
jgi:hypothetical protein